MPGPISTCWFVNRFQTQNTDPQLPYFIEAKTITFEVDFDPPNGIAGRDCLMEVKAMSIKTSGVSTPATKNGNDYYVIHATDTFTLKAAGPVYQSATVTEKSNLNIPDTLPTMDSRLATFSWVTQTLLNTIPAAVVVPYGPRRWKFTLEREFVYPNFSVGDVLIEIGILFSPLD